MSNITHFIKRTGPGGIVKVFAVYDAREDIAASFSNDKGGEIAYQLFLARIASRAATNWSLFDRDTGQWIIGDIGQLAQEPAA